MRKRHRNSTAVSNPSAIAMCVVAVEMALQRGNRDEAIAAIDRAMAQPCEVSWNGYVPLAQLNLDVRTLNALENMGYRDAREVAGDGPNIIASQKHMKTATIAKIAAALCAARLVSTPSAVHREWRLIAAKGS